MMVLFGKIERAARYLMSVVTVLAALVWIAFRCGWISEAPSYKKDAWYLASRNAAMIVATEYADEASCRRDEKAAMTCRSGKALTELFVRERQTLR